MTHPLAATEAERLAFEAWCRESEQFTDWSRNGITGEYLKPRVQLAWEAWRAGRASQQSAAQATAEPAAYSPNAADWPEDFAQENGNYENRCNSCGIGFMGNKHRRVCRVCAAPDRAPSTEPDLDDALSAVLWLYHRLPRGYDNQPHIERVVRSLATATSSDGDMLLRELGREGAPSTDSAADARDAARYRFMMSFQDGGEQPEEILMMWRKVIAEHRLAPTRADYESAIDAAIAASMPQKEEAPPYERRRFER